MPRLSQIYYYPIKGLPGLPLASVAVQRGERLPLDRHYAIGDDSTPFDPTSPAHIRKQKLVAQMSHAKLAELQPDFDPASHRLRLSHRGSVQIDAVLSRKAERQQVEAFLTDFLAGTIRGRARLISAPGLAFTDLAHQSVSIINLNSVRALEQKLGYRIDPRRFRANLYIDGLPAWQEENWLEKTVSIGGVPLTVYRITDRCAAINVDPETAERDQTLQGLKKQFGHLNMGVYATLDGDGELHEGAAISETKQA